MPKWTEEQSQAINARESNLLVSAAAGSGKTAVLVERIIKLITEDLIDIDKLLIVTFTKAAAGEMRERIVRGITEKIENKTGDEEHLRKQLTILNKASITTIHSFCKNIVKQNFHIIGIDPSFKIGDATEINIMLSEVLEELMENEYKNEDELFIKLVEGFGGNKEDIKLQELILRLYFFIQSKPYPLEWLKESVEMYDIDKEKFEESLWTKTVKENISIELRGAFNIIEEAIRLTNSINGPIEYEEALIDDKKNIGILTNSLNDGLEEFYRIVHNIEHTKFKPIRKNRKIEIDENLLEEVKSLRDNYKKKIIDNIKNDILSKSIDKNIEQIKEMHPIMDYLYTIIKEFDEMYSKLKIESGLLDFNDLEHFTLKILENEDISNSIKEKYNYIFVDEYQDSNIVQETIINRIKRNNNLFLVGDVKQSIYRFRMADPTLFINKYENFGIDENSLDRKIVLSNNFRSRYEILEGVNFIFKNIMSKTLGEIDYDKESYLNKGLDFMSIEDDRIEINLIDKNIGDDDIDDELKELSNIEIEAKLISKKIKEMIGKKTYNPKTSEYKNIDYKDIVILLRATKNWAPIFQEKLLDEGIPVYSDDSSGYFDVMEVKLFLNLLILIDNKKQDLPLISVMRSPIGKFTTEELINIRINERQGTYFDAILKYVSEKEDELKDKLVKFISLIETLREESRYLKLDEFIWKALIETSYYYYVAAMPGGKQRQANLRILVDRAEQFEKSSLNGLFNFIRFIDKIAKSGSDLSTAKTIGENENVVRIMSIHKSKGLEFPVVICAGMGKQFNLMDAREDILLHKDLGLGTKYFDIDKRIYSETFSQIAIKGKIKLESLSEEMRILYVALTRAVDILILFGTINDINKQTKKWIRKNSIYNFVKAKNYIDWIMTVVSKHKDINLSIEKYDDITIDTEGSKWKLNIINKSDIINEEAKKNDEFDELKNTLMNFKNENISEHKDYIEYNLNWKYNFYKSIKIPSKVSVTDIKKASAGDIDLINYKIPSLLSMPKFLDDNRKLTSAEKGTILHFVMQHIDLNQVNTLEDIEKQIDKMVLNDLLLNEEAKIIDVEKIKLFFESNIGRRILKSNHVFREAPFVINKTASEVINELNNCNENLLVQGIIDCYFYENDYLVLVDYKTDYIEDNNIDILVNRYRSQINEYKIALEKISQKRVKEAYIYSFFLNKEIKVKK